MVTTDPAEQHEELRQSVRKWAEAEIAPRIPQMEACAAVERELLLAAARKGWIGVTIDRAYGGMGLGHTARTVVIEEFSRVSAAMGAAIQASILGVAKIIMWGSDEQRRVWLPQVAAGTCLPTIATTEAVSGGHVLGMRTTARRDGSDWVINGSKAFVGNSHVGDVHGVIARTGDGSTKSRELSAFLVPAGTPGLHLVPYEETQSMGLRGFGFGDLVFTDCRVPAEALIGEEGDGLDVAYSSSVLYGRSNLAAVALGIHQAVAETTARYAGDLSRYEAPLAEHPVIEARLGRIHSNLRTARTLAYQAVDLLDQGRACDLDLMNAKLTAVELGERSAQLGLKVHGAAGLRTRNPIERYFRDAHHIDPPAGTADIQLHRLGKDDAQHREWSVRFAGARPGAAVPA